MESKQRGIAIGAVIGAVLGAGSAYLLMTSPAEPKEGEEEVKIKAKDLLTITKTTAALIRKLDDVRRKT